MGLKKGKDVVSAHFNGELLTSVPDTTMYRWFATCPS